MRIKTTWKVIIETITTAKSGGLGMTIKIAPFSALFFALVYPLPS
ncbi:hypothetical protein [Vibrio cholerae]|nr:putative membrane protein [Vibrio cholerae HC-43B1]EJH64565.1 putative membrane protein [Vibrio cholerae HE-45]EKK91672.1 putative membrane protein [Vibrio cholerae CP1035(8)]EKM02911.1 putative membrane protein [Vibrio cholerae HC-44C1]EMP84746.1 putative membrane protein [Vibrio cholerae O1 str. 116063]EMQ52053.1 putative membrane protein [Vibrio cholerae O1 str. EM-1676A]CFW05211.1 hypothetical protein [Vibrio cholerae]